MNKLIVKEYLESLKEDTELDYIFPILLTQMGHQIIATPKDSKGQSQYGKDVVSIGKDKDGVLRKFYFELKGGTDRNIDSDTYNKSDGIRTSLQEAKDTPFEDSSIPGFNALEHCIILVHNGVLKRNIRVQFEGFIKKNFKLGEFERWGIDELTDLFSEHLFDAYLLTDEESLKLFKRFLILQDMPEYDFKDLKFLVDLQIKKISEHKSKKTDSRAFKKIFATQQLVASMVYHYGCENNNLEPAKTNISYLVIKTWGWILNQSLEKDKNVIKEFNKLLSFQYKVLKRYFDKTLPIALLPDGLFGERGHFFEQIGYPIRCFEYLNYLTYYYKLSKYFDSTLDTTDFKNQLYQVVGNNDATCRPILDIHSIGILNTLLYVLEDMKTETDKKFIAFYINKLFENIKLIRQQRGRFPLLNSSLKPLMEYVASNQRPPEYGDESSLLITLLFDFLAMLNAKPFYDEYQSFFKETPNLQLFYPYFDKYDIEQLLFTKEINDEGYVEHSIKLEETFEAFKEKMSKLEHAQQNYKTDEAGYPFLRHLAHTYYKTPYFPYEWRKYYKL